MRWIAVLIPFFLRYPVAWGDPGRGAVCKLDPVTQCRLSSLGDHTEFYLVAGRFGLGSQKHSINLPHDETEAVTTSGIAAGLVLVVCNQLGMSKSISWKTSLASIETLRGFFIVLTGQS